MGASKLARTGHAHPALGGPPKYLPVRVIPPVNVLTSVIAVIVAVRLSDRRGRLSKAVITAYDLARRAPSLVEAVVAVDALAVPEPSRSAAPRPDPWMDLGPGRRTPPGGPFLPADLLRLRNRHLGARDSRCLPQVVALADPPAESPMETRTRLALVLHGLPAPVSQFEVRDGRHRHYLDLAYPEYRVGIEYDGREHLKPEGARRDLERQHRLSQLGWVLVRPRAALVLQRPYLVAVSVLRELEQAAERLGLPKIPAIVAPLR